MLQTGANGGQRELPLVVQLGFAGSRVLFDPKANPAVDAEKFHGAVEIWLAERLTQLHAELGLDARHFFCGISQVAIGADTIFSRACRSLGILQRVFLPQQSDEYLQAVGNGETPDFSRAEQEVARSLLEGPNVIQQHVVSESPDRQTRFEEANLEIARASDVVVCLVRAEAEGKAGGTNDLIAQAAAHGRPVLEIRVAVVERQPRFSETWHGRDKFRAGSLPETLSTVRLPKDAVAAETPVADYCQALKQFGSLQANWLRKLFTLAATVIIGTHVLATLLAACALAAHGAETIPWLAAHGETLIPWLLGFEIASLVFGLCVHQYLHRSHAGTVWAVSRLVAELARSVKAVGRLHVSLEYLFTLPFPESLQPVLRTVNVLHLKNTRGNRSDTWQEDRGLYLATRLEGETGQIKYYSSKLTSAKKRLAVARFAFLCCSVGAILATGLKLLAVVHWIHLTSVYDELAPRGLGTLAIVLPTIAVGILSLAAALDLEARQHTYDELHEFLGHQKDRFLNASELSYPRLVLETESRLLGETANWFSRRSFIGVA